VFLFFSALFTGCQYKTINNSPQSFGDGQVTTVLSPLNMSAFGEVMGVEVTPVIQFDNKYAITNPGALSQFEASTGGSGSVTSTGLATTGNLLQVSTGTTLGAYAVLNSKSSLIYRDGEGVEARFTAKFTGGAADSMQYAGLFSSTDRIAFGYAGTDFSIIHGYGGVARVQTITIIAPGSGTFRGIIVTLDGTAVTVNFDTNITTTAQVAVGLADQLNASALNATWTFQSVNDGTNNTVICVSKIAGTRSGSYSLSFPTSGVGVVAANASMTQTVAGAEMTYANIPQSSWNVTTTPFTNYATTNLNLYRISFGYLGVADINFYVYNPNTAKFVLVHKIKWALSATTTHMQSADLKIGIGAQNFSTAVPPVTSTTNLTVQSASMFMGLQGKRIISDTTNTVSATRPSGNVTTTETTLLSLANRIAYGNRNNRGKIYPTSITVDTNGGNPMLVNLKRNIILSTLSGSNVTSTNLGSFNYINENNSIALSNATNTAPANLGGTLLFSFVMGSAQTSVVSLQDIGIELLPGDILTVTGTGIGGSTQTPVTVSLNWQEEK